MKSPAVALTLLLFCSYAAYGQLTLLKDIGNIFDASSSGSDARSLVDVNGTLFFAGRSEKGYELWKSDGVNTTLVKDIWPGIQSSNPCNLTNVNGTLFFVANDGLSGAALYKSDGTENGTVLIKVLPSTSFSNNEGAFNDVVKTGVGTGLLYFSISRSGTYDLWRSDGTTDGTYLLSNDIFIPTGDNLVTLGNILIFLKSGPLLSLWRSDGTLNGTVKVNVPGLAPDRLVRSGDKVFFVGLTSVNGAEIWKTDGTDAGTQLVKDLNAGSASSNISQLINFNGKLLFYVSSGAQVGTWKSDGTSTGTEYVGATVISNTYKVIGDKIYYSKLPAGGISYVLHVWDATTNTSNPVTGPSGGVLGAAGFVEFNGRLYFTASEGDFLGTEVWYADGTTATMITDFPYFENANEGQTASQLTKVGSDLYFVSGSEPHVGNELWKTNGSVGNLTQVTNMPNVNYGGFFGRPVVMDEHLYFSAATTETGSEPWKSDGTAAGTGILKDIKLPDGIVSGQYASSAPGPFIAGNHHIFFTTYSPAGGLFSSDGTASGTVQISNTQTYVYDPLFYNDVLYFYSGVSVRKVIAPYTTAEVIASDGTNNITDLLLHKGNLYFKSQTADYERIWKYDLSNNTKTKITETYRVGFMATAGDLLYYSGEGGTVWVADETTQTKLKELSFLPYFNYSKDVNGTLYFLAEDPDHGTELWKSNGTAAGTVLVKDIFEGIGSSVGNMYGSMTVGNSLYFVADDGVHGKELWSTDGTAQGTKIVKDIYQGIYGSEPNNFLVHNDALYFTAYDGKVRTLWKTTGSDCGTIKVTDNTTVIAGGESESITLLNETIFVSGWAPEVGSEFFTHKISNDLPLSEGCKLGQVITLEPVTDKIDGGLPFRIVGSSDAGLDITFLTDTPDLVSVQGDNVTILKAGRGKIIATAAGDANHDSATANQSFCINPKKPKITLEANGEEIILHSDNTTADATSWYRSGEANAITNENGPSLTAPFDGEYYCVAIVDDCFSDISDVVEVARQGTVTGLGETETVDTINVFPNPASEKIKIELLSNERKDIQLMDLQGRSLKSLQSHETSITLDVSGFVPGVYLLKVNDKVRRVLIR